MRSHCREIGFRKHATACSSAGKTGRVPANPDPIIRGEVSREHVELALKMKLERQLAFREQNKEEFKKQMVVMPSGDVKYHYKYYEEFPDGPEKVDLTVTPTEKLTPPFEGEARYRKVLFQTRYSQSKSTAAKDNDFIRDEGIQTDAYEFDGKKWRLKSSVFEVRKTSVYDEKGWRATQGRLRRVEEEEPELFIDKAKNLFGIFD